MKLNKNKLIIILFCLVFSKIFCLDIETAINSGNSILNHNGTFYKIPDFGFKLVLNEDLGKSIHGTLAVEREPGIGNTVWSRVSYIKDYLQIGIGPTLGILNTDSLKSNFITFFQPGFGITMSFRTPKGFLAAIDTNFSIPFMSGKQNSIYLQHGYIEFGWQFPNIITALKLTQKNKAIVKDSGEIYVTVMDIGLYTTAYSKPSKIRIPFNFIYRENRFNKKDSVSENKKINSMVLETGFTHVISSEIEWFIHFGAAVFSFSDNEQISPLKNFLFNAEAGIRFSI